MKATENTLSLAAAECPEVSVLVVGNTRTYVAWACGHTGGTGAV